MNNDILLNKIDTIRRCMRRIQEEYSNQDDHLYDYTKQDSIILNLQRACEASIDLAMHIVSNRSLGIPQTSRDAFELLHSHNIIDAVVANQLKAMVGFRNIAVHDYQSVQIPILKSIITEHLVDFETFIGQIKKNPSTD